MQPRRVTTTIACITITMHPKGFASMQIPLRFCTARTTCAEEHAPATDDLRSPCGAWAQSVCIACGTLECKPVPSLTQAAATARPRAVATSQAASCADMPREGSRRGLRVARTHRGLRLARISARPVQAACEFRQCRSRQSQLMPPILKLLPLLWKPVQAAAKAADLAPRKSYAASLVGAPCRPCGALSRQPSIQPSMWGSLVGAPRPVRVPHPNF